MGIRAITLLMALGASQPSKPSLTLRVFPRMAIRPVEALLTLSLEGPEQEKYYCPQVEWEYAGLRATHGSDCPPWEQREEYPNRWTRRQVFPCGDWPIKARLTKNNKTLLIADSVIRVACD